MKTVIGNVNMGPLLQLRSVSLCAFTEGWRLVLTKLSGIVLSVQGPWALVFSVTNLSCLQSPGVFPRGYSPNNRKS